MTTTSTATLDPRAKRWGVFAKYAALLIVGFLVAPFIFTAITGLLGLIAAGLIMLGTWMVLPAVETFAANLRLKLVKGEAARNPVPTLENELNRQQVALDQRKTAIGRLEGQIATLSDKVDGIGQKYGKNDPSYIKLAAQLADLRRVAKNREDKWQAAYVQVKRFAEEIERAGMIWDAAMAAAAAQESSGLTEEEFMAQLKTQTSFDTIRTTFNDTLASLDTDLMQSDAEKLASVPAAPAVEDADVPEAAPATPAPKSKARR